jgi:hypothetical protein
MKSIVIKYGTISGLIAAALMLTSMLIEKKSGYGSNTEFIGYMGIALAFIPLYLGMRQYRQTEGGGAMTFWKGLNVGIIIIVISGLFYAVSWLITYYWITPDFPDKYSAFLVGQIKSSVQNLKDTAAIHKQLRDTIMVKQQMVQYKEMAKNPLIFGAITFTEPLPLGIVLTLVCAAILRKNPAPSQNSGVITDAVVVEGKTE